jgi:hypothetical protein
LNTPGSSFGRALPERLDHEAHRPGPAGHGLGFIR